MRKTVRYYNKKITNYNYIQNDYQQVKVTTYWLLGFIPVYSNSEVISGKYEGR